MASSWFYSVKGQRQGPVDSKRLKELARHGGLSPTDMVWHEGMIEWIPASKVRGLFPEGIAVPPPMPPEAASAAVPAVVKMETPIPAAQPRETALAKAAKWTTIGWTMLCFVWAISGVANVGDSEALNNAERAGQAIGVGCGLGLIFGAWMLVAIPAVIVWVVARKS
jgi:hypothetical protein